MSSFDLQTCAVVHVCLHTHLHTIDSKETLNKWYLLYSYIYLFTLCLLVYVYICSGLHMLFPHLEVRGRFSLSILWVLGIKIRLPALATKTSTHWAVLISQYSLFLKEFNLTTSFLNFLSGSDSKNSHIWLRFPNDKIICFFFFFTKF